MRVINRMFGPIAAAGLLLPAAIGGSATQSWHGAATAFFWAGLVRVAVVHHVSWSVNSICHMVGDRPFGARDHSANFWPLAILSLGESWHNFHHADPTCARHGVEPGQIDIAARTIWVFERMGWVYDVRWQNPHRIERLRRRTRLQPSPDPDADSSHAQVTAAAPIDRQERLAGSRRTGGRLAVDERPTARQVSLASQGIQNR